MTPFISTSRSKFLGSDDNQDAIAIHLLSTETINDFVSGLTSNQSLWVTSNGFKAHNGEVFNLADDSGKLVAVLVGMGKKPLSYGLSTLAKAAKSLPPGHYLLADDSLSDNHLKLIATGWAIAQYEFDRYKEKKNKHHAVLNLKDEEIIDAASILATGICLVRDLVNTPTCDMGPSHLSAVMSDLSDQYKASFSSIVGDELLKRGFDTIHTVGRAALNEPRLLDMSWGRDGAPKITLVGKGVCFDSGGLDLKPAAGMRLMKKDMGGAANVLGLAQMIMASKLDIRLRVLIPAVENNIAGDAFRPGDIIHTYKGTSVEVGNTDAEGRLVLCDALALAAEETPELLLDFATLTGAARVAMGTDIVPFFTDNDDLAAQLKDRSRQADDPVWRLPLYDGYVPQLKSNFADLSNIGSSAFGGAITAALFLRHFVDEPLNWVHFDLYAWNLKEKPTCPEGGEAMAIRTVFSYLQEQYSQA